MARTTLSLPPAPATMRARGRRAADFLAWTWRGRVLLASVLVVVLTHAGVPMPCGLDVFGSIAVFCYAVWGAFRLGRYLVRRLLWRIRTKLIVSYLFIAVVPVVLLLLLFGLAALLFSGLVASHIVTADIQAKADVLHATARSALTSAGRPGAAEVDALVEPARKVHPDVSYVVVRGGRVVAEHGAAPKTLPAWVKPPGFAGLVKEERPRGAAGGMDGGAGLRDHRRAAGRAPVRRPAPADGSAVPRRRGPGRSQRRRRPAHRHRRHRRSDPGRRRRGMIFVATPERRRWSDGEVELDPLAFRFDPYELGRRLSPSAQLNVADLLVKLLAVVAGIFLVMYVVALLLGLLLARSITTGIHELFAGDRAPAAGRLLPSHPRVTAATSSATSRSRST